MNVRYTIDAFLHIAAIQSHISERNPAAAIRVVARIRSAEQLDDFRSLDMRAPPRENTSGW